MSYVQTMEQLAQMKLQGMLQAYREICDRPEWAEASFDDKLSHLVEQEYERRENSRVRRYIREAGFKEHCELADILYPGRNLSKDVVEQFSRLHWLKNHENIVLTGATGTGKSFLAQALGNLACTHNYRVQYYRVPELIRILQFGKHAKDYWNIRRKLQSKDVLILDDWGLSTLDLESGHEIAEVIEDRLGKRSTIVASQFPVKDWDKIFIDRTTADAVMDRLIHVAYVLNLEGDSLRANQASKELRDFKHLQQMIE